MPVEVTVWIVLIGIAVAFQMRSVFAGSKWGMLTSSVRWLRVRLWGRMLLFPFLFWLTMHWFIVDLIVGDPIVWYPVSLALGFVAALFLDYKDYWETIEE